MRTVTDGMPDGLLGLATALVGIPSVSHHEAAMADAVQAALELCPWLEVDRVGDNVVARTDLGTGAAGAARRAPRHRPPGRTATTSPVSRAPPSTGWGRPT